jgi:hypothetical protein
LDNAIEQQEFQNIRKEALMHECVRDLQEQEENVLRKMVFELLNSKKSAD